MPFDDRGSTTPERGASGDPPRSTYRLQLGPNLRFSDVAGIADYLAELGVTHAYLSPILEAAPGSTHGYDVVEHTRLSPELGGARGFATLVKTLRAHGIGVLLDIVPNHMAIPTPESLNRALWAVLRDGQTSPFAPWFDIDWNDPASLGRVMLPVLAGPLDENLDDLSIDRKRGVAPVLRYYDHEFPLAKDTADLPLRQALDAQHYRLADWREAASHLNYRRFMDISTLIGLRVEDPAVFSGTHRVVIDLVASGDVDCLRIDHPDGLADPAGYLSDLASATGGIWTVVEKILSDDEPLPPDWNAAGTTGYETLTIVNRLLVDPAGEQPLSRVYTDLTGATSDFGEVARQAKGLIAREALPAELNRLARIFYAETGTTPSDRDLGDARDVLVDVLCELDVYRPFASSPRAIEALERACARAVEGRPHDKELVEKIRRRAVDGSEFATRFGQTAAALYAKGIEDTAFYRHGRLLSLNEVGGDPSRFGVAIDDFHRYAATVQERTPHAMTTLTTHDTKRDEDVRARIAVLSELPADWENAVRRWLVIGESLGCPDPHTGYFFWQTLVGAWPLDAPRAARYMEKSTREAKLSTSWLSPNASYDKALCDFVDNVFNDDGIIADVGMFVATIEPYAAANSLTQKLIQLTMPGVPDIYQGCELATFHLVDPDNRGAVDFGVRREALRWLLDDKLRVTATSVRLRRDHPDWFSSYLPLLASGAAAEHVVAFARSPSLVTVASRLAAKLRRDGGWRDTTLTLPEGAWVDALSGREHPGGVPLPLADLIGDSSVALMVPGVTVTDSQ